jgi:hypothetical protein
VSAGPPIRLASGRMMIVTVLAYDTTDKHDRARGATALMALTSSTGIHWEFAGTIASTFNWTHHPLINRGNVPSSPSECSLVKLADHRLMAVFRVSGINHSLWQSFGDATGQAWSTPRPMYARSVGASQSDPRTPHSVDPGVVHLANGAVILSAGRVGNFVWGVVDDETLGRDGSSDDWVSANIAANHNAKVSPPEWRFCDSWVSGTMAFEEGCGSKPTDRGKYGSAGTGYTGIVALPNTNDTALICYDLGRHGSSTFGGPWGRDPYFHSIWCVNVTATIHPRS